MKITVDTDNKTAILSVTGITTLTYNNNLVSSSERPLVTLSYSAFKEIINDTYNFLGIIKKILRDEPSTIRPSHGVEIQLSATEIEMKITIGSDIIKNVWEKDTNTIKAFPRNSISWTCIELAYFLYWTFKFINLIETPSDRYGNVWSLENL